MNTSTTFIFEEKADFWSLWGLSENEIKCKVNFIKKFNFANFFIHEPIFFKQKIGLTKGMECCKSVDGNFILVWLQM